MLFIESILKHKTDSIRYMDVQSYIADYFSNRSELQTPFFVNQSNATEIFLDKLISIQSFFENNNHITNDNEGVNQEIENDKIDIIEQLKTLSKQYISKDVAQENIEYIFDENKLNNIFNDDIRSIYDIKIDKCNDYNIISNINKLYNEIEKNKKISLLILDTSKSLILLRNGFQKREIHMMLLGISPMISCLAGIMKKKRLKNTEI